jgi:hypothetical protein
MLIVRKTRTPVVKKIASEVKGPIRCHKCQQLCCDATEYRSHSCYSQLWLQSPAQISRFIESVTSSKP